MAKATGQVSAGCHFGCFASLPAWAPTPQAAIVAGGISGSSSAARPPLVGRPPNRNAYRLTKEQVQKGVGGGQAHRRQVQCARSSLRRVQVRRVSIGDHSPRHHRDRPSDSERLGLVAPFQERNVFVDVPCASSIVKWVGPLGIGVPSEVELQSHRGRHQTVPRRSRGRSWRRHRC